MSKNLTINLRPKLDANGKTYYIGILKSPMLIDCKDGAVFLIYVSEDGMEELQVASLINKKEFGDGSL